VLVRIGIVIGILALLNMYAGYSIIGRWPLAQVNAGYAWMLAFAFFLLQLAGPFGDRTFLARLRRRGAKSLARAIDYASYLAFGILSTLVAYALVASVVSVGWRLVAPPADTVAFDARVLLALIAATLLSILVGLLQALAGPAVRRVTIPLRNLPGSFAGFTIAQVSDLHVGPTIGRAYAQRAVAMTNALQPDLVALTGDFIDGSVADLAADIAPVAQLRAPHGVYFITGNHEYIWNGAQWIAHFAQLGARVLVNEHVLIRRNEDAIVLAGVTDHSTRHLQSAHASSPERALAGAPPGLARILLAHHPASFALAEPAGFDLQLSGHTHSGQYFPFSFLIRYFQRFYAGLYRHGNLWIYVNRGTGYWGPPLRTGVRAEVTLITLECA
jgi:predicted MPP superfamily phosphohydrolase